MQGDKLEGIIKSWNSLRGFGFIEVGDYPQVQDYFAHISQFLGTNEPQQGDCVMFELARDHRRGNLVASKIKETCKCVSSEYLSPSYRSQIRKSLKAERQERIQKSRQRYMQTQQFKNEYGYERKEGYFCRTCRREFDETSSSFQCICKRQNDYWN